MVSRVIPVDPFELVLFGATGDLARRKIIPGLFHRFVVGQMPPKARIIGAARTETTHDAFVHLIRESLGEFEPKAADKAAEIAAFLETLRYVCVDAAGDAGWRGLGQYRAGNDAAGYRDHAGYPQSLTESFVAMKVHIGNWRWAGTPVYLRTGKKLRARTSEIAIMFRNPPHMIFPKIEGRRGNALLIRLQPDKGITLRTTIKDPGPGCVRVAEVALDMTFAEAQNAHERLIMDVIRGDQSLFMRGDEVEAAWAWVDPMIRQWEEDGQAPAPYDVGSSGP